MINEVNRQVVARYGGTVGLPHTATAYRPAQDLGEGAIYVRLRSRSPICRWPANELFQCLLPQSGDGGPWPYHGVPANVLVGTEQPDGVHQERRGGLPAVIPDTIVTDHGKQDMSAHVIGACARLGICVQPAIPNKPTDKPTVERFFGTMRESLLQHLPGYKGPDVYSRGKDVEQGAFYYVAELEQILREWVTTVYHHTQHDGLALAELPRARFTPAQMFEVGLARTGGLALPASRDLAFEFLDVKWRTIQHHGVEVNGCATTARR